MLALDLDAPFPLLPVLGPILHGIQPGLTAGASGDLTTSTPPVAGYIGPAPPPRKSCHPVSFLSNRLVFFCLVHEYMILFHRRGWNFQIMDQTKYQRDKWDTERGKPHTDLIPVSGPHRYVFLLYEQPSGFDAKKFMPQAEGQEFPMMQRIRFDPSKFVKDAGLGEVLAGNYFESN